MNDWVMWIVLAGVLLILEMFSGTFYLLMFALSMLAGALAAYMGATVALQMLVVAVVGIVLTVVLRRSKYGNRKSKLKARKDPNALLDIGRTVEVAAWAEKAGSHVAQIKYRGAQWRVELEGEHVQAVAGMFVITEIRGSTLIVKNVH